MNNSSVRSKLGQLRVLQAFEEQPGAEVQPHLLSCRCLHVQEEVEQGPDQARGLGFADGVQEGPHVLEESSQLWKTPKHQIQPPPAKSCTQLVQPHTTCHTEHFPGGFSVSSAEQSNKWHLQGIFEANKGVHRGLGAPTSPQHCLSLQLPSYHQLNCLRHALKCKDLINALRFFYKMEDGVYNLGVFLLTGFHALICPT